MAVTRLTFNNNNNNNNILYSSQQEIKAVVINELIKKITIDLGNFVLKFTINHTMN